MTLLDQQQTGFDKARKQPAHGFDLHAPITADIFPAHAQIEFIRRITAQGVAVGRIEQEIALLPRDGRLCGDN